MLCFTKLCRWAPNYFRNAPKPQKGRRAAVSANAAKMTRTPSGTTRTSPPPESTSHVPPIISSRAPRGMATPALTPMQQLVEQAGVLLRRATSAVVSEKDWQFVNFCARSEVFGPLRSSLPPVSDDVSAAPPTGALPSRRALVVVPDGQIAVVDTLVGGAGQCTCGGPTVGDQAGAAGLSLAALNVLLQLYHLTECEDGVLLRQLLGELRHTVMQLGSSSKPELTASDAHALPSLLLTLTELGLIEEAVLQTIIRTPHHHKLRGRYEPPVIGAASQDGNSSYHAYLLSSRQMRHYTEQELVVLLVAWHRFGLHHDPVFARTTTTLRRRLRLAPAVRSFAHAVQRIKRRMATMTPSGLGSATSDEHAADETSALAALHSQVPATMRCPTPLLVEAITALSQSVFRHPDVVTLLADLLAVEAAGRLASHHTIASGDCKSGDEGRQADVEMMNLSRHLLRATKLCEYMDTPQILLATAFTWSCTASGKGVIVDGGEGDEQDLERRVYYDNVTADLIKLRHVK